MAAPVPSTVSTTRRADATVVLVSRDGGGGVAQTAAAIRGFGFSPVLVTGVLRPEARTRLAQHVDEIVVLDDWSDPARLAALAKDTAGGLPRGLFSCSDASIVPAARAAELLGIGRVSVAGLECARNKYAMRCALRDAGLPTPPFALISDAAQAPAVAQRVGLPAVIKPLNGTAGSLVKRVASVAELAEAYRVLAERAPKAMSGHYAQQVTDPDGGVIDTSRTFLVEGMLRGREYCADVLVRDGVVEHVVLLDKFLIDGDFYERGFAWPPLPDSGADEDLIRDVIEEAVLTLGLDNVGAHVEVIDDMVAGPTVVEVNAGRVGGQMIPTLVEYGTGIFLFAEQVALALGLPAPERQPPKLPPPLATLTVFADGHGRLKAIHGLDALARHPDVLIVGVLMKPGDYITDEYEMFPVNVLVVGLETREELVRAYEEIASLVRFEIEPELDDPATED